MGETADQLFVILQHWLVGYAPTSLRSILSALLSVVAILVVFALLFAITTVLERKGLGRIQNRYGPNRVGPFGFLQPIADGIKSLTKEDIVPQAADKVVHFLAPVVLVIAAFSLYAVLPIGRNMVLANLDAGVLFFFAVSSVMELTIFMAGWSSRNKYSLLGAMRAIAQMISYEVPLILASVTVIMAAGSLSTVTIVERQAGYTGIFPHWFVFTPWGFAGFVLFHDRGNCRIQPLALRPAGRRIGDHCGLLHGVLWIQIRAFFPGRISWHVCHQRIGNHTVPGRMGGTAFLPDLDPFVPLVFREALGPDQRLYMGSRHSAPVAYGSADELCLEVYAADGAAEPRHCRRLALFAARLVAMVCLRSSGGCSVCSAGPRIGARMET